jgi:PAS domain S-box-containing protein
MARPAYNYEEFQSDFEILYEEAPIPYQSLGPDGEILLVNKKWLSLLGYDRHEIENRPLTDFMSPASQIIFRENFKNVRRNACSSQDILELIHKSGEVIAVRIEGRAVFDADGEFVRSHCIVQDVRVEREARQAQDRSEGRYRRLVELAREGIWEIDAEAHTVFVNPAMAAMLEYTEEEMIGKHLFEFMDERGRELSERNLGRREKGIDEQHDFEFMTKSGRRVTTTMEASPLFDADGLYTGSLAGVMDITERRRFEQEMGHTQKLESLGVLAGGIAHDFNNLLQAVVGNAELALTDLHDGPLARESLLEIQRAASRATDLCRQMLAYAGRTHFQIEQVDLARLVRDMSEILQVGMSKKARLEVDLASDLPLFEADPSQLSQVILNLITNASEALEGKDGTVRVTARLEDLDRAKLKKNFPLTKLIPGFYVVLSVEDTGSGMAPETLSNIFDPFYTTKFAGRGLGLAAVQGIVQGHGGAIAVDSIQGKGTTFRLALPHNTVPPVEPESDGVQSSINDLKCLTVLIAEDEISVTRIVHRFMDHLGQKVLPAVNGREALEVFREKRTEIDVVMLDLSMPIMDGKEAMKEIRALDPEMPIIICSGFPAEDIAKGFGSDQPDFFMQKPFVADQLRQALLKCSR